MRAYQFKFELPINNGKVAMKDLQKIAKMIVKHDLLKGETIAMADSKEFITYWTKLDDFIACEYHVNGIATLERVDVPQED